MMHLRDLGCRARRLGAGRSARLGIALAAVALAGAVSPAGAKVVDVPEHDPKVTLNVPDGWSVTYSSMGVELRSPEKNSVIVANLFKGRKAEAEAWPAQAVRLMEQAGVSIEKTAQASTPAAKPPSDLSRFAMPPGDHFTFSGAPSVNAPGGITPSVGTSGSLAAVTFGTAPVGSTVRNKIPHKIVTYKGGSFAGKPTDVQLYIFSLKQDELFLIEQQSGGSDARAIDIVYSVKAVH